MKKKIKVKDLKRIIKESFNRDILLNEDVSALEREKEDSVDNQIDRFLLQYENESQDLAESKNYRDFVKKFLLEAEDEDKDKNEKEVEEKKISADKIDIDSFTSSVVRLIENYDNLLELKTTIAKRAKNFLIKHYELEVAKQFEDILAETFEITIGDKQGLLAPAQSRAGGSDEAGFTGGGGFGGEAE